MAFYAGQLVRRAELENPTIVVITDRNGSRLVENPGAAAAEIQNLSKMFTDIAAELMSSAMVPKPICSAR